jgi:hypothetical protein
MKVPRNFPCPCGSGKKYKKCCGDPLKEKTQQAPDFYETTAGRHVLEKAVDMMIPKKPPRMVSRPQMQTVFSGHKVRAVRNTIHFRPLEETFFDFQLNLLLWTLGEDWHNEAMRKPPDERHIVLKWRAERNELLNKYRKRDAAPTEPVKTPLTGNVKALQVLADDIYQLQHALETPKKIIERLRNMREFQGARYEVLVASLFARCGFSIEFIDDRSKKNPEFFATKDGERIAVEAKSRRRAGVLHEKGEYLADAQPVPARIRGLFQEALEQNPGGVPFMTFIDVNLPLTPTTQPIERAWVKEAMKCFDDRKRDGLPESDSGLILTNIGWHYHRDVGAPPSESVTAKPEAPLFPIRDETWALLTQALNEYGVLVDEEQTPEVPVQERRRAPGWFRYGYFVKGPNNSVRAAGETYARTPDTYKKGDSLGVRNAVEGIVVAVLRPEKPNPNGFDVMVVLEERIPVAR